MKIAIRGLEFSLFIGDLPWERTHLQKVSVDIEIEVKGKAPDYWAISKAVLSEFSKSHYEWVEDLAQTMSKFLRKRFKVRGRLIVRKFPKVAHSPKVFEVETAI